MAELPEPEVEITLGDEGEGAQPVAGKRSSAGASARSADRKEKDMGKKKPDRSRWSGWKECAGANLAAELDVGVDVGVVVDAGEAETEEL